MRVRRMVAAVVVVMACWLGAGAAGAQAGSYTVRVCSDGNGAGSNNVFSPSSSGAGHAYADCAPNRGLYTDIAPWGSWAGFPDGGALQMCAPSGTRITAFSANAQTWWQGSGYDRRVDGGPCGGYAYFAGGGLPSQFSAYDFTTLSASNISTGGLRLLTFCSWSPCSGNYAQTQWDWVNVTIDDYTAPTVTGGRGLWGQGGWVRGTWNVAFDAADSTGVRWMMAEVDRHRSPSAWRATTSPACQPDGNVIRLNPCDSTTATLSRQFDTTAVADGGHDLSLHAEDGAHNTNWSGESLFNVDNTAPSASLNRAAGSYSRTVTWNVSDAHSGVDGGSLAASYSTNNGASWQPMSGSWDAGTGTYSATVPASAADGSVQVRVGGRDNANPGGNAFTSSASTVTVDTAKPQAPSVAVPARWLNRADPTYYDVGLATPAPPPSGISGYSVSRDTTDPDATVERPGATATWRVDDLADGITTIKARAVSGAGVGGETAEAVIRVDRELPAATLRGAGAPETPHPGPITVTLSGHDGVSGMAYVAFKLDGAADWTRIAGDEAHIAVAGDGTHTLEYFVIDAAGNTSATQTRPIAIRRGVPTGRPPTAGFADRSDNPATTFTAAKRFGDPCPAQATLMADRDAMVAEGSPNTRAGALGTMAVGPAQDRRDAIVGFPLPAAPDCTVQSATLRLNTRSLGNAVGRPVEVTRASSSWSEPAVTWSTRPGTVGPGATAHGAAGWMEWNVTAQVQGLYAYGDNGLYVRDAGPVDPAGATQLGFCSRECVDGNARPQLVLRFSE